MTDRKFGELVEQYERLVYTICYQFTHNHHTAQDLAQDTFLSVYRHKNSCPIENMKPWIARIATNKAKDFLKSAYNRKMFASSHDTLPESGDFLFQNQQLPEEITIEKDVVKKIEQDILALKEPYNKVAVFYFIQEKTVPEIAEILERPPKTIHTQLYRAKQILQKSIEIEGGKSNGTVL